jgi:hypothetical protein
MRRGPKSPFGSKQPPNPALALTPLAKAIVAGNVARTDVNQSNVVEYLIRRFAGPKLDSELRAIVADFEAEEQDERNARQALSA